MNILSFGEFDDIIEWTPDGLSFVVNKPKALVEKVFPLYFKKEAVQDSSFTRKVRVDMDKFLILSYSFHPYLISLLIFLTSYIVFLQLHRWGFIKIMRGKDVVPAAVVIPVFLKLFRCKDKDLRKFLHGIIISDLKLIN